MLCGSCEFPSVCFRVSKILVGRAMCVSAGTKRGDGGDDDDDDNDATAAAMMMEMMMMMRLGKRERGRAHTNSQVGCLNRVCETKSRREEKKSKEGGGRGSFKGSTGGGGEEDSLEAGREGEGTWVRTLEGRRAKKKKRRKKYDVRARGNDCPTPTSDLTEDH